MAGNIVIGTLRTLLTADASDYKSGLADAEQKTEGFSSTVTGLGKTIAAAFSFRDVAAGVADVVDSAGKIADVSDKLGIGAEAIQRLSFAAQQGGASMETVAGAMTKMSDNIAVGGKGTTAALDSIGLSIDNLKGMAPDVAFAAIADAIQKVPDPMQQTALAMDLLGKKGVELLPAIKAGITEVGNTAPVMSAQVVAAGAAAGDAWDAQQAKMQALKAQALGPLIEGFMALPGSVQTAAAGIASFAPSLETVTTAIIGMGGPVAALGKLKEAGLGIATFFSASGGIGVALTWLTTFLTTTLPAAFGTIVAFLGPQGIIALALLALAAVWYFWGDEITAAVTAAYEACKEWLLDKLQPLFDLVAAALEALSGAWTVAKDAVIEVVTNLYNAVKEWIVDKAIALFDLVKAALDLYIGFWRAAFDLVVGVVTGIYNGIKTWLVDNFTGLVNLMKAGIDVYVNAFTAAKDLVIGVVTALYSGIKEWLVDKFQAIVDGVKGMLAGYTAAFTSAKDTVVAAASAIYEGVKGWLVDKFQAIVDGVKAKIDAVTGAFRSMYQTVVGGSIVPDMMKDLGTQFGTLTAKMFNPSELATKGVTKLFETMGVNCGGLVGDMLGVVGNMLGNFVSNAVPKFASALSSGMGSAAQSTMSSVGSMMSGALSGIMTAGLGSVVSIGMEWANKGLEAFAKHLQGGEEGMVVNPGRDAFFDMFVAREGGDAFSAMAGAFDKAGVGGDVAERLIGMLYNAKTESQMDVAISEIRRLLPDYSSGTGGFTDFGSGTLAMLHGREAVIPESDMPGLARTFEDDRTQTINIYQDGLLTASRVVKHMPRVLALNGVG